MKSQTRRDPDGSETKPRTQDCDGFKAIRQLSGAIPQVCSSQRFRKTQDELACEEEDDEHDFQVGIEFRREECNFNPLSMLANGGAAGLESNRGGRDTDLPSHRDGGESRRETDVEVLLT